VLGVVFVATEEFDPMLDMEVELHVAEDDDPDVVVVSILELVAVEAMESWCWA
jgi:hypothetical protein